MKKTMIALLIFLIPAVAAAMGTITLTMQAPLTRADGTTLEAGEVTRLCFRAYAVADEYNADGARIAQRWSESSSIKCVPASDLIPIPPSPVWVVAANWTRPDAPIYVSYDDRTSIGRAPIGEPCGDFVHDSTGGRTWRAFAGGIVRCELR